MVNRLSSSNVQSRSKFNLAESDRLAYLDEFNAWHFFNYGTFPKPEDIDTREDHKDEVLRWKVGNEAYIDAYTFLEDRNTILNLLIRSPLPDPDEIGRLNLWDIRTNKEIEFIDAALVENATYIELMKKAKGWIKEPDYKTVGVAYFLFAPLGAILHWRKSKSRKAYMKALSIQYHATDTFYRSIDVEADYQERLALLHSGYKNRVAG